MHHIYGFYPLYTQNELQVTIRYSETDQYGKGCTLVISKYVRYTPVGTWGLSRECVLRIPMRVVKGD